MGMTTSEMRTTFERWILGTRKQTQPFGLIERSGEGYFDLYTQKHWEGWQAALATPSVASPRAAWKDDALQSRINEAVDEANGVTAAPVGEPGRMPQAMSAIDCESVAGKTTLAVTQGCRAPDLPQQPCYTCEGEKGLPATRAVYICADCAGDDEPTAPPAQGAPTKEGTCKEKLFS
jgi:hypothetical protein